MYEGDIDRLPLTCDRPATQACAVTGTRTRDLLLCGTKPKHLSHATQGYKINFGPDISPNSQEIIKRSPYLHEQLFNNS